MFHTYYFEKCGLIVENIHLVAHKSILFLRLWMYVTELFLPDFSRHFKDLRVISTLTSLVNEGLDE